MDIKVEATVRQPEMEGTATGLTVGLQADMAKAFAPHRETLLLLRQVKGCRRHQ